jgi:hypothetical protein
MSNRARGDFCPYVAPPLVIAHDGPPSMTDAVASAIRLALEAIKRWEAPGEASVGFEPIAVLLIPRDFGALVLERAVEAVFAFEPSSAPLLRYVSVKCVNWELFPFLST